MCAATSTVRDTLCSTCVINDHSPAPVLAAPHHRVAPACVLVAADRYEFGKVASDGRRDIMASGRSPSATLTGLDLSAAAVYVCAVDNVGAKVRPQLQLSCSFRYLSVSTALCARWFFPY